jgi:hypothetical protein
MASRKASATTMDYRVLENFVYGEKPRDMGRKATGGSGFAGCNSYPKGEPVFHVRGGALFSYEMPIGMRCRDGFVVLSSEGMTHCTCDHLAKYRSYIGAEPGGGEVPAAADYRVGRGGLEDRPARLGRTGKVVHPAEPAREITVTVVSEQVMRDLVQDHRRELAEGARPHLALAGVRLRADGTDALAARARTVLRAMGLPLKTREHNELKRVLNAFVESVKAARRLEAM